MVKGVLPKPAAAPSVAGPAEGVIKAKGQRAAQATMDALKRLEKAGRPYPMQAYRALKGHQAKRSFAQRLELDPEASWLSIEEANFASSVENTSTKGGWSYLWDVARLNGVEWNPADEKIVDFCKMLVADCPSKESPKPQIKAQGWLLYDYWKDMETEQQESTGKKVTVKAEAELDKEHYQGCLDMVRGGRGQVSRGRSSNDGANEKKRPRVRRLRRPTPKSFS